MYRFSLEKRFWLPVSFSEFTEMGLALIAALREHSRRTEAFMLTEPLVLTCEDVNTYNFSHVTVVTDDVEQALKSRKTYPFSEFTFKEWERSYDVQLTLKDPAETLLMVTLSCDRRADRSRILFYGQGFDETVWDTCTEKFRQPDFKYKVGEGWPKLSPFNVAYVSNRYGIKL